MKNITIEQNTTRNKEFFVNLELKIEKNSSTNLNTPKLTQNRLEHHYNNNK